MKDQTATEAQRLPCSARTAPVVSVKVGVARSLLTAAIFVVALLLYGVTVAPGTVFGDPSEYQFIPAIWGIAHPPGYAFYTLLAGVWQRVVRIGTVAYRTNLLAAFAGAWAVSRMVLVGAEAARNDVARDGTGARTPAHRWALYTGLVTGLALVVMSDLWQHSIHANAHIVSVAITATQLWLLVRWQTTDRVGWLFAAAFTVGIGVTHHPITVWGLPAYGVFILVHRPQLFLDVRVLAGGLMSGLLGLLPWLYFPLRSPTAPFGPADMATWAGFLRHATAQGLRVNLFHFGLVDLPDRWQVFVSLLQLQYGWWLMALIVIGGIRMAVRRTQLAVLWGLFLLGHVGFTINTVQDVMAYLLHPFVALSVPLGLGALTLVEGVRRHRRRWGRGLAIVFVLLPWARGLHLLPRISLASWEAADDYIEGLVADFRGEGSGAAFISDWEHLTPYFYHMYVEDLPLPEEDLRPVYVTGSLPWTEAVFANLPAGPIYLSGYRREIRELGFRLRPDPEGDLWQVVEPPAVAPVSPQVRLDDVWVDDRIELIGYDLPITTVAQGGVVPIVLYARAQVSVTEILMPLGTLGTVEQRWTTDSRRLTPAWQPGEIIAERYEVFVPYGLEPGVYPLGLGYVNMSDGNRRLSFSGGDDAIPLGTIQVVDHPWAVRAARVVNRALANVGNDVALVSARARVGPGVRRGLWQQPLTARPGQALHLTLRWRVLARPRTSYTVFIHLIDAQGHSVLGYDYTPLGGAFPSYLWFPKWLEGQQVSDPYRLTVPETLPPGQYWLEVGMYEMGSIRRIPHLASDGTMVGDRAILGPLVVAAE